MATTHETGDSIPTLSDMMFATEDRFVALATSGAIDDELIGALAHVFAGPEQSFVDLVIYARGCHAMAEVYRQQGRDSDAGLYHAMGQELLGKATYAVSVGIGEAVKPLRKH